MNEPKTEGKRLNVDQLLAQRMVILVASIAKNPEESEQVSKIIGALGDRILQDHASLNWARMKRGMSQDDYETLLTKLQNKGNGAHKRKNYENAMAYEFVAVSLAAHTRRHVASFRQGEILMDKHINTCVSKHRADPMSSRNIPKAVTRL